VESVAGQTVAGHLGINFRAAPLGVLQLLKNQNAGTLAHDETVTALVVGPRGGARAVVVGGGQSTGSRESGDAEAADRRFRTARDHHIGVFPHDQTGSVANGVGAGRAGRDGRVVGAFETVEDRNMAGCQIDQGRRDEKR
jgi:hypothetical protein